MCSGLAEADTNPSLRYRLANQLADPAGVEVHPELQVVMERYPEGAGYHDGADENPPAAAAATEVVVMMP